MVAGMLSVTISFLLSQIPHAMQFSNETFYFSEENTSRIAMTMMIADSLNNLLTPLFLLITGTAFREKLCFVTWLTWHILTLLLRVQRQISKQISWNGNIFRVTCPLCGEFIGHQWIPPQRPVTQSFDGFFDLLLNKRLSKQSWRQ